MIKFLLKPYLILLLLTLPIAAFCQSPVPKWVDDFGGSGDSKATGMATDGQNNIYITGYFSGTVDFDPSSGVKNLTSAGNYDIYIAKYTPTGVLIWAKSFGGPDLDHVNDLTVDANGNPTIIGQYNSSTITAGAFTLQNQGDDDIFIMHFDTNGNVVWAKSIGGVGTDRGEEISADAHGNLFTTSIFSASINLNGTTITNNSGQYNALITKFDASGNLLWDIVLGGNGDNQVYGVNADSNGNVVVAGTYSGSVDFDPLGTHNTLTGGSAAPFLAKYTSAGKLSWVKVINGSFAFNQSVVAIGPNNDIYLTGGFTGSATFNGNTTLNAHGQDTFVAKYLSTGAFVFAEDIGGGGASSYPYQIQSDAADNVYVTGYFSGTIDFNPSPTATADVSYHGQVDFYAFKLDKNGAYQWAFGGGSPNCNQTLGIEMSVNTLDNMVLAGSFCGTVNFDPTNCGALNLTAQNQVSDSFLATYLQGAGAASQITGFSIPQEISPAVIDQATDSIVVKVAPGTNLTSLVPTIAVSNNGTVAPASGVAQNFTSPVVYTVTGCSTIKYTVHVVAYVAKRDTICSAASGTLIGDAENPVPASYAWQAFQNNAWSSAPGSINSANYQTSALVNTSGSSVVFQLRRKITAGGVTSYDSFYDVDVVPAGGLSNNAITAPTTILFCGSGSPTVITGSIPTGGSGVYTYQWQSSTDNSTFVNLASDTLKNFTPPSLTATTYYRRIVSSGICTAPSTSNVVKFTILPALAGNVITAPADTSFCDNGTPGTITGSLPTGGDNTYIYQWQASTDGVTFNNIAGAGGQNYAPGLLNTTTYYQRIVSSGDCTVPNSNVVTIYVHPAPATPVPDASVVAVCPGSSATLSISSPQTGISYNWYSNASKTKLLFTGATFVTGAITSDTTFYVDAASTTCSSPATASVSVNLNPLPAAPVIANPALSTCSGSAATISISNTQAGFTYSWYSAASGGSALFSGTDFTTPALTSNTTYYAEAVNTTGCSSARSAATVMVNPLPDIAGQGATVCPDSTATLTASSTDNNAIINWYANASGGPILFTGATYIITGVSSATTYYAEAADKSTGCMSASRAVVNISIVQPLSLPVISTESKTAISITFQWTAVTGATGYRVSIDSGKTFINPSSGPNGLTTILTGLQAGQKVSIIVQALGSSPCQTSESLSFTTATDNYPADLIYVPNAFTPNGDGHNDEVHVHSESIRSMSFYIYDQWGELLFTSTSLQDGWDGTYKGTKEPVGVYVYYVQARMNDGQTITKKGTITLLR